MTARHRIIGLLATAGVLTIVAGMPAVLLAIGATPAPTTVPTWDAVVDALTRPDDGTLAVKALSVLAWGTWLFLTGTILLEISARVRGLTAPPLPGLALPQAAARGLVSAAVLLFVAGPSLTTAPTAAAATAPVSPAATQVHKVTAATSPPVAPKSATRADPTRREHTVTGGESLWSIAQDHLGDGARYPEIAALNRRILAGRPAFLLPGTVLALPAPHRPDAAAGEERTYIVRRGDTLSGIAHEQLGDAGRYPEIFDASWHITQPGGKHLSDPDVIDIGWTMAIPGQPSGTATAPTTQPPGTGADPLPPPSRVPDTWPTAQPDSGAARADAPPTTSMPQRQAAPEPTPRSNQPSVSEVETSEAPAPWLLAGLVGGPVLAGSLWILLRQRRVAQLRHRRPGRTIATPPLSLAPVEKSLATLGTQTVPTVEFVDDALRRLASAKARDGQPMPKLAAVELTATDVTLHLSSAAALPSPWVDLGDGRRWVLPASTDPQTLGELVPDQPAPYPLLVTIGTTDTGDPWLLNGEDHVLTLTGDPTYAADLARYVAAEVACNPWSAGARIDGVGVAGDVAPLNPDRVRPHTPSTDPAAEVLADAVNTIDRAADHDDDATTARAHIAGPDAWPARMLVIDEVHTHTASAQQLIELLNSHPGATGTGVVINGARAHTPGLVVEHTASGRVRLPHAGLDLVAVGLTTDEAQGCAALLAATHQLEDVPVPVDEDAKDGWRAFTDQAGALRDEHTLPRATPATDVGDPVESVLPARDEEYLHSAATTRADLATLAPQVTHAVRDSVRDADPTLDGDVAAWFADDCSLPRLTLLGPVRARTRGKALAERKPYMTEVLAYIATRPHGATPDEVADVMGITVNKAREYARIVRDWLGANPRTGAAHLPDARHSPAAQTRGVGVYQVLDLLIDADLFRRLRARGQTRGPDGIHDLTTALRLVQGRPFDQLRYPGWAWLHEGDRLDHHLTAAIVDVAHTVTTHALHASDLVLARLATETALRAAPEEEIPRLDLAHIAKAEGQHAAAEHILRKDVSNRSHDDGPPPDLSDRSQQILESHDWANSKRSAS
ncbi:LysM peptidoglycan-binding domain-containing protein [Knoellia sp. S7-12]|uniref:LysM peptidoglycan-binding domain-containing protein n=1 Tax=Knoellia sp. S7-12 TaxID=3126698 RepID=UPI0033681306